MTDVPSPPPPTGPSIVWADDATALDDAIARVRRPRTALRRLSPAALGGVLVVAVGAQLAVRVNGASLIAGLTIVLTATLIVARPGMVAPPPSRASIVAATTAGFFGVLLPLRASGWLEALNAGVAVAALGAAALLRLGPQTSFSTGTIRALVRRGFSAVEAPMVVARSLRPASNGTFGRYVPLVRGLALASLPLAVFGALLASADAVFAELLTPDLRIDRLADHVALTALCAIAAVGLLSVSDAFVEDDAARPGWLGGTEAAVILAAIAMLFGGFALTQLVGALGMADDVLASRGVSTADYARSGYFQLLWVAALTALLLAGIHLAQQSPGDPTDRAGRAGRLLGSLVCVLTVAIVASAIVRLDLYTDAFGQTTLRWYSNAFAWVLGVGFVLAAVAHHAAAQHLMRALLGLSLAALIICNIVNPEARVASHNLGRAVPGDAASLDADYLAGLSADAWPVLLEHRTELEAWGPIDAACTRAGRPLGWGPLGFNLARARLDCSG